MGRYQKHIFICTNERPEDHPKGCCSRKGSEKLKSLFKDGLKTQGVLSIVRANSAGCLDACEHGPVVVIYPEAVWYGHVTEGDVTEIIQEHIIGGRAVDRLKISDPKYSSESPIEPLMLKK